MINTGKRGYAMRHEVFGNVLAESQRRQPTESTGFWDDMLSVRGLAAMARSDDRRTYLKTATELEALPHLSIARTSLDLATETAIRRMHAKNPDIIQSLRQFEDGPVVGIFAYLPLSEFGAAAIAHGIFDGAMPDPAWIVGSNETPVAFYEWLFYGPGLYLRSLSAIGDLYRMLAPLGAPVFSKGTTQQSEAILRKLGFQDASLFYNDARPGFVVLLPSQKITQSIGKSAKAYEVRQVRSFEELAHVISIRSATYIAEQFPLYGEEFDGNDFCGTHLVGYIDGDPAGCIRIRYFGDFVKLERLAVKLEYRKSRLAFALVKAARAHIKKKGFRRIYGHASDEVAPFWKLLGAVPMKDRLPFRFANVEYREMSCEIEADPLAISYGVPPMMTIRPEGLWDEASALDWSNFGGDPMREQLLKEHARKKRS
jgi:predicted GNAT family N-acyltransferase